MTPIDCSSPGSSVHGNLQIRILECVAISFFEGSSWPRDRIQVSCSSRQILYCLSHQGSLYGFYTPLLYIHTHTYTQGASLSRPCKGRIPVFFHHQESDQFPLFRDHLSIWGAALRKTRGTSLQSVWGSFISVHPGCVTTSISCWARPWDLERTLSLHRSPSLDRLAGNRWGQSLRLLWLYRWDPSQHGRDSKRPALDASRREFSLSSLCELGTIAW